METERKPNEKPPMKGGFSFGGAYWTRTSDPIDVNDVLYQLSQSTMSLYKPISAFVTRVTFTERSASD